MGSLDGWVGPVAEPDPVPAGDAGRKSGPRPGLQPLARQPALRYARHGTTPRRRAGDGVESGQEVAWAATWVAKLPRSLL